MRNVKVKEILPFSFTDPSIVYENADVKEVARKMVEDHQTREVYVKDIEDHFLGVITLRRLARCVFVSETPVQKSAVSLLELMSAKTARDLALRKPTYVYEDDSFEKLLKVMFRFDINEIPVLDSQDRIIGNINMLEIISAWLQGQLDHLSHSG